MTAPSVAHEDRVRALETLAVLAGAAIPAEIGGECVPDVARISADGAVLLVADAKATETPGCEATARRLLRYIRAVRPMVEGGVVVRLAVCHGDPRQQKEWQRRLSLLATSAGLATAERPATATFDADTLVTWVDLRSAGPRPARSGAA